MPLAVDLTSHASAASGGGITSLSWNHTCSVGANKLAVLSGSGFSGIIAQRQVSQVSYNSINLAGGEAVDSDNAANWASTSIWYTDSPTADGAAHTITVSWGTGQSQAAGVGISFTGADLGVAAVGEGEGSTANPSCTIASSQSGDICISVVFSDTGPVTTTNANGTEIFEDEDINADSDFSTQRQTAVGASTVCSWTCSDTTNPWAACGMAIRGTPSGPTIGNTRITSRFVGSPVQRYFFRQPTFLPDVIAAAGASVVLTPGTASLVLTGFAPTVQTPRLVTPGKASLVLTGFAPRVILGTVVTPGKASLILTGFAPTVLTPRLVTPGKASLVLTGFAPVITVGGNKTVIPGTASLVLTGFAPTVLTPRLVTPGKASLILTGFAPTVIVSIVVVNDRRISSMLAAKHVRRRMRR